ncbi:MAG: efflux RND transporter periplasmic adaptor subunit [Burkholderiales bacterium]|nr:efflux RND transporter periplasmic adaptor subunit [Burkholderiales bacterium]
MNARHDLPSSNPALGADAAWASLAEASSAEALCRAWLAVLCSLVPGVQVGLLLLQDAGGSYVPAAAWPEGTELQRLADIARECLGTRQGVRRQHVGHPVQLAYPLAAGNALHGAVVIELLDASPEAARLAARLTHWGAGWMADLFAQRELGQARQRLDESAFLFEVSLAALAEPDFHQAGLTLVNKLAARFGCHQVQLALAASDTRVLRMAHGRYAADSGSLALVSQPLAIGAAPPFAVLLFERNTVFQPAELKGMELLAGVLAPVLEHKHARDEGLAQHAHRSLRHAAARLTDTSHPGLKLGAGVLTLLLLIAAIVPVEHRVSAPAIVEGAVQRSAVVPFDGFLRDAPARAGDTVKAGQLLARMDDRDLQLEKVRWETELEMAQRKEREAMAQADRVNQRLSAAQANQARAQLDLTLSKLSRVELVAPFDAVVVKGDLSQQLGAPLEMGKTLFELAPLASWRVMLKIDERDVARVQPGQGGDLVLTGAPGQRWHFKLKSVTPVSVVEEGRNYFRAEAQIAELEGQPGLKLKPNMEGVAKVVVGERSLLWVWTHRFTDWLSLALWQWTP